MDDFIIILCYVCVYVLHCIRSSEHNALYIHQWQDRDKPCNVPNPQGLPFSIYFYTAVRWKILDFTVTPNRFDNVLTYARRTCVILQF